MNGGTEPIYEPSSPEGGLRQGEILCDLIQFMVDRQGSEPGAAPSQGAEKIHPFALVVSQDCDLDWDFKARQEGGANQQRLVPNVLFCEVTTAENLRARSDIKSDLWKLIKGNRDERYQFLQKVEETEDYRLQGLPELAVDFKRYFTIPTEEVYIQLKSGTQRRCRLRTPYVEHLSSRFYSFQSRVALPSPHSSEPVS